MQPFDSHPDGGGPANPPTDDNISATCLTDMDILLLALEDGGTPSDYTVQHVRACESCRARLNRFRGVLGEVAALPDDMTVDSDPCLDESTLALLADDSGATMATHRQIAHLTRCAHCRRELASLASLLADPQVAREIREFEPVSISTPASRRRFAFPVRGVSALAAAAVVLFLVSPAGERVSRPTPRHDGVEAPSHRAPTITASEAPVPKSPVGDVDAVAAFRWNAVPGADRYRLTLYNDAGHVVYEAQLLDTTLALPDAVVTLPGRSYLWQVEARTGLDRWTSPELIEFRVVAPRAP